MPTVLVIVVCYDAAAAVDFSGGAFIILCTGLEILCVFFCDVWPNGASSNSRHSSIFQVSSIFETVPGILCISTSVILCPCTWLTLV